MCTNFIFWVCKIRTVINRTDSCISYTIFFVIPVFVICFMVFQPGQKLFGGNDPGFILFSLMIHSKLPGIEFFLNIPVSLIPGFTHPPGCFNLLQSFSDYITVHSGFECSLGTILLTAPVRIVWTSPVTILPVRTQICYKIFATVFTFSNVEFVCNQEMQRCNTRILYRFTVLCHERFLKHLIHYDFELSLELKLQSNHQKIQFPCQYSMSYNSA